MLCTQFLSILVCATCMINIYFLCILFMVHVSFEMNMINCCYIKLEIVLYPVIRHQCEGTTSSKVTLINLIYCRKLFNPFSKFHWNFYVSNLENTCIFVWNNLNFLHLFPWNTILLLILLATSNFQTDTISQLQTVEERKCAIRKLWKKVNT